MALHIPLLSDAEIEAGVTSDGTPLPPVPVPTSPSDLPPERSEPLVVGTSKEKLLYWWDWDHGDVQLWIPGPPAPQPIPNASLETNSFYGPFPDYTLTRRLFWSRVDYQRLDGGGTYTRAETTTEGMSSTEETSISAELNVGSRNSV